MIINITIVDYLNYGNRLQSFALQKVLARYDDRVLTVPNLSPWEGCGWRGVFYNTAKKCYRFVYPSYRNFRYRRFMLFTKKNIPTFPFEVPRILHRLQKRATFVVGSDQVWNPYFDHLSEFDTLSFLKDKKGISYAASFGVDELPEEYAPKLAEIGKNFKAISVREVTGKKILEPYVNEVQVHVDPTLLLTAQEWETIMHKPRRFTKKKFVALYFLGRLNETRRSQIIEFAKKHEYEIVELMDKPSVYYTYGPAEFLWVMQHAEAVFTDSFHGCVFSFLFDKPFVVYDREDHNQNMSSRMETLLPLFHLEDRAYTGRLPEDLLVHDYSSGYAVLEKERERSFDYLKQNFS